MDWNWQYLSAFLVEVVIKVLVIEEENSILNCLIVRQHGSLV